MSLSQLACNLQVCELFLMELRRLANYGDNSVSLSILPCCFLSSFLPDDFSLFLSLFLGLCYLQPMIFFLISKGVLLLPRSGAAKSVGLHICFLNWIYILSVFWMIRMSTPYNNNNLSSFQWCGCRCRCGWW